jgi:hypothetical protein
MTYKEFRKWLYENWDAIYDEFEKSVAKSRISMDSFANVKDIDAGIPNNFKIVKNKDTLYVLPAEPKPIKVKFKENSNETV